MNVDIRKISNGYILKLGDKETFCDVPEAICGLMAEWIMEECKLLETKRTADVTAEVQKALAQAMVSDPSKGASLFPRYLQHVKLLNE